MRLVALVVLSLALSGITLAAAPSAAACVPPNCPGFGDCDVKTTRVEMSDPVGPVSGVDVPVGLDCKY